MVLQFLSDPSTLVVAGIPTKTRLESTNKYFFKPHLIYGCFAGLVLNQTVSVSDIFEIQLNDYGICPADSVRGGGNVDGGTGGGTGRAVRAAASVNIKYQITNQTGATDGFEMCFGWGSWHLTQLKPVLNTEYGSVNNHMRCTIDVCRRFQVVGSCCGTTSTTTGIAVGCSWMTTSIARWRRSWKKQKGRPRTRKKGKIEHT